MNKQSVKKKKRKSKKKKLNFVIWSFIYVSNLEKSDHFFKEIGEVQNYNKPHLNLKYPEQ